ncbi:hypothetical protein H9623_02835 [Oerskovia sp. Sa1BUA8]|uniref:Uncharacterized protein n=1 Tax=Oerskovia douganii TaxID=2762210 RepID=A0A9D5UE25_9CELL|nr:hypothetical protein [Oerskovia douganii]MBE7699242.1 hypothetical protein [Oerskovia douganii]
MTTNYDAAWSKLPASVRDRLIEDPECLLTADDVTALAHAGAPPLLVYWTDGQPATGERWLLTGSFERYVRTKALEAERATLVDEGFVVGTYAPGQAVRFPVRSVEDVTDRVRAIDVELRDLAKE